MRIGPRGALALVAIAALLTLATLLARPALDRLPPPRPVTTAPSAGADQATPADQVREPDPSAQPSATPS